MGRSLTPAERATRRKEEERERRRRSREVEERRRQRAERQERIVRQTQAAAQAEFDEWQREEDDIAQLAAPKSPIRNVKERLLKNLMRRPFEDGQFVPEQFEEGRFSFDRPLGPSAPLVDQVRYEASKRIEDEFGRNPGAGRVIHAAAWIGSAAAIILVLMGLLDTGPLESSNRWLIAGVLVVGTLILTVVGSQMKKSQRERISTSVNTEAAARAEVIFRDAEAKRLKAFEDRQASTMQAFQSAEEDRRAQHEKKEDSRIAQLQGRLNGDSKALQRWLSWWMGKFVDSIEFSIDLTGAVQSNKRL